MSEGPGSDGRTGWGRDGTEAPRVVSLGSVNLDRVHEVTAADVDRYEQRYDWFPAADETVRVERVEADFGEPDELHHGGKGANQAVAAARAGATAAMLGVVGPDADEAGVFDALAAAGVATDDLATADVPTGTAHVFREPSGENRIVVVAGANGRLDRAYVRGVASVVRDADCLLIQNEVPAAPVAELLADLADRPDRPTVVFDPAPADGAGRLLDCEAVDYCTPNEHEYERLRPRFADFEGVLLRKHGPDPVVVEGAERDGDGDAGSFAVTPPSVEVTDTTGAGDVFAGFLATALARGVGLRTAVETATVAASLSTRVAGARAGVPTPAEVRAFRSVGSGRDAGRTDGN